MVEMGQEWDESEEEEGEKKRCDSGLRFKSGRKLES